MADLQERRIKEIRSRVKAAMAHDDLPALEKEHDRILADQCQEAGFPNVMVGRYRERAFSTKRFDKRMAKMRPTPQA